MAKQNRTRPATTGAPLIALLAGLAGSLASQAQGQFSYDVGSTFNLDPKDDFALVIEYTQFVYRSHGKVKSKKCRDNDRNNDKEKLPFQTLGTYTRGVDTDNVNSDAQALTEVIVTHWDSDRVEGTFRAYGAGTVTDQPSCNKTKGKGGKSKGRSTCKVRLHTGQTVKNPEGGTEYDGNWESTAKHKGKGKVKLARDPIIARKIDNGIVTQWTMMDVRSELVDGTTAWRGGTLRGEGREYRLVVDISSPVVADPGYIEVRVENHLVTVSKATGRFGYLKDGNKQNGELPKINDGGGFAVPLPKVTLNWDLGPVDPSHTVYCEFDLSSGGQADTAHASLCDDIRPHYISGLGDGFDDLDTSSPQFPLTRLGFSVNDGDQHLMEFNEFCGVAPGTPIYLGDMMWPIFQETSQPITPPVAVYVQIWDKSPLLGGVVIDGDLSTDRLEDYEYPGVYRVDPFDLTNDTRPIGELEIDMSWVKPLPAGPVYGIEVVVVGAPGTPTVQSPIAPFPQDPALFQPALRFDEQSGQWSTLIDNGLGCQIPYELWGDATADEDEDYADFEPPLYDGSLDGLILSNQNGWFNPGGVDFNVFEYAGNILGLPDSPLGGQQFAAGVSEGGPGQAARAQRDADFSTSDQWVLSYDTAVTFAGQLPAQPNLSSFQLQPGNASKTFVSLNNFEDPNNPTTWKAEYSIFNADGSPLNNQSPGGPWTGLLTNHWYNIATTVNFATNLVTHVAITDLSSGQTSETNPIEWYLAGGADPNAFPLPTAVRLFVGGTAGDTAGFDNLIITEAEAPPLCYPDFTGDGQLDLFDFLAYLNAFNGGDPSADCDANGGLDLFDFLCFVNAFNTGC